MVCIGGLKLGFGTFQQPYAGFMPFLCGVVLGLLALADLISGVLLGRWKAEIGEKDIWAGINWAKLILVMALLFVYVALFTRLGFIIGTVLLLLFLFRVMGPRPWWVIFILSVVTTGLFYLVFKVGLNSQMPKGFLGF